jgi:hypothetical protein
VSARRDVEAYVGLDPAVGAEHEDHGPQCGGPLASLGGVLEEEEAVGAPLGLDQERVVEALHLRHHRPAKRNAELVAVGAVAQRLGEPDHSVMRYA